MDAARSSRDEFLRRSCVRFVIVNKRRASDSLRKFAVEALGLMPVHEDEAYELFTPVDPPACEPRPRRSHRTFRAFVWRDEPSP